MEWTATMRYTRYLRAWVLGRWAFLLVVVALAVGMGLYFTSGASAGARIGTVAALVAVYWRLPREPLPCGCGASSG